MGDQAPHQVKPGSEIRDAWDRYRSLCVPAGAGEVQVRECRYAFYAGAHELLMRLMTIEAGPPNVAPTEEQLNAGAHFLESVRLELQAFAINVGARRI